MLGLLLLCSLATAGAIAPIPLLPEDPGYRYDPDSEGAQVTLDAFIELNCPESNVSWPTLKALQEHYGPQRLSLVVHIVPLPYHRNAHLTTQGFHVVKARAPDRVLDFMDYILENHDALYDSVTENMTQVDVISLLAEMQEPVTGIAVDDFIDDIFLYRRDVIFAWKFAVRRGVAGTPWFMVNNIDLSADPNQIIEFDEWQDILDPLFPEEKTRQEVHANHHKKTGRLRIEDDIDKIRAHQPKTKKQPVLIKDKE